MEKHNKDLENIRIERDSSQATLTQTNANYSELKTKKDSMSVEHNKLQRDYRNMQQTFLKQHKEFKELKVDIGKVY